MKSTKLYVTRDGDKIWHRERSEVFSDLQMTERPGRRDDGPALILSPAMNLWIVQGMKSMKWHKRQIVKVWTCHNCGRATKWIGASGDFYNETEICDC